MRLILGSASARRRVLLETLGLVPDAIVPPDIDETPKDNELPRVYAARMAREKVAAVAAMAGGRGNVVLCADTVVAMGRRILGKAADLAEAEAYLTALSGRRHRVYTALAVRGDKQVWERVVESRVRMKRLSKIEINGYLATGDWRGKAGAYAIQGPAGAFIPWIVGSHSAIMGLPLAETACLLTAAGYPVWDQSWQP